MTGRRQDAIWQHFTKLQENDKLVRAKCKHCEKEMCSLVARMKLHIHKCNSINKDKVYDQFEVDDIDHNDESERQNCKYINISTLHYKMKQYITYYSHCKNKLHTHTHTQTRLKLITL